MNGLIEYCDYRTPCGFCTKWDKECDKKIEYTKNVIKMKDLPNSEEFEKFKNYLVDDLIKINILEENHDLG